MVRANKRVFLLAVATVLGAGVPAMAGSAVQAAPAMSRAVTVRSVPAVQGQLQGVSADSATDAWAVGYYADINVGQQPEPVTVHWDGTTWSQVPSPNPGNAELYGVSALSPTDAWAVGCECNPQTGSASTFIVHWDGTAWSQVPSPSPDTGDVLNSVSAISATDVWAVGTGTTSTESQRTLTLHWNGTAWSQVNSPSPGTGGAGLSSVSAASDTDVWAAGTSVNGRQDKSLTLHWNGTAWSRTPSPNPGSFAELAGVSAVPGADAWAVGTSFGPANLALHWTGTTWSKVNVPSPGTNTRELDGVSADSATDAWAVGWGRQNTKFEPFFTVTLHWNGTAWKRVTSPDPGNGNGEGISQTFAVSAQSPTNAWAVGTASSGPGLTGMYIMILHWNGTAWSAT